MTAHLRAVRPGELAPGGAALRLTPKQQDLVIGVLPWIHRHVTTTFPRVEQHVRDDMLAWGAFGASTAVLRFEGDTKAQFLTFCKARIAGAIVDWLRQEGRQTKLKLAASRAGRNKMEDLPDTFNVVFDSEAENEERLMTCAARLMAAMAAGVAAASPTPEEALIDAEEHRVAVRVVQAAFVTMPEAERKVYRLRYGEDMTLKQIGKAIGVAESTARRWHDQLLDRIALALLEADITELPQPMDREGEG